MLELIRLCKKWNNVKKATTIPSYLLETMIVNYCDSKTTLSQFIDYRFRDALKYIADNIMNSVNDMKEIQGDINTLLDSDRSKLKEKANNDYQKACEASEMENVNKEKAIRLWGEILGGDFPTYG